MNEEITFLLFLVVINTGLVTGTCPSTCSCSSGSSGSNVNCYSKSLGHIPDLPSDTYIIYLHYNKIRSLESDTFINLTNVYQLYLHNNEISAIESFTFMNLHNLQYL
ncbi:unnamed protein product [Mytilus coruscus]|uniref:LRRNT domain-containing protein n=1 Tax=Mytilus coruscus TaxID=42192 RepID=A0A6J7ZVP5_MYTCO|nr:unnamed protein product [Mytilus coruscus]